MPDKEKSFLISGGGTGGHIFPAVAIADELRKRFPSCRIHFVGSKDRMEMQRVPDAGYTISGLWISGINRSNMLKNLSFPFKVISSILKSKKIIRKHRPDVVIGTGGFASGPLLYAANQKGIPTLIQEQNSFPGITNKLLANKANKICVAYDGLDKYFPKEKIVITGNPIRKDLLKALPKQEESLKHFDLKPAPTLLIVGGSLGAKKVNEGVEQVYRAWLEKGYNIIWQTGKLYIDDIQSRLLQSDRLWVGAFIKDMSAAMGAADLVVSRAGAGTLSELEVLGKACILIPSPNVAEDHQTHNARALEEEGAAVMIKEAELADRLQNEVIELMEKPDLRAALSNQASGRAKPRSTQEIADIIENLMEA